MASKPITLERVLQDHNKSQSEIARAVGVTPQAVGDVVRKGRQVPAEWCLPIERETGGKVTRHDLRPDLYPRDETPA